ncbi:MAG: GNAT family N-acetyltransferase [Gemmatimonadota bacterium]
MPHFVIPAPRLDLVLESKVAVLARIAAMPPADRAQVSPDWLARLHAAAPGDPWTHGFALVERDGGAVVGSCAFKGPPGPDGAVEIAYGVEPDRRGKGYATEAACALAAFALGTGSVRVVRAHTEPHRGASARVLAKCGFTLLGEVVDPEDGPVWRWERSLRGGTAT